MKEAEHKVVTPFVSANEQKARVQAKVVQASEDIHVGPNTQLSGGFHTHGMMIVDGLIDKADISAERLIVSHIGKLEGVAKVQRAELSGTFEGELVAEDEVILRPTAKVSGSVRCQKLVVHRGARIECVFACIPDCTTEPSDSGHAAARANKPHRSSFFGTARERRLVFTGAGAVLSLIGAIGLLISLRMVLTGA
jgi:cytoskeletal protein CcmA (bactofilin family)/preprotein translocase subunit Sss1